MTSSIRRSSGRFTSTRLSAGVAMAALTLGALTACGTQQADPAGGGDTTPPATTSPAPTTPGSTSQSPDVTTEPGDGTSGPGSITPMPPETSPSGDPSAPPIPVPTTAPSTDDRATEIADLWRAGPLAKWQSTLTPIGGMGSPDGFVDGKAKEAWMMGQVTFSGTAVTAKATEVTTPDGTTFTPPLLSAEKVLDRELGQRIEGKGGITITSVTESTLAVQTNHGEVTVPAYTYQSDAVKGGEFTLAALDPRDFGEPNVMPEGAPPVFLPGGRALHNAMSLVDLNGTKLTVNVGHGACDEDLTAEVTEFDDMVVVTASSKVFSGACTAQLVITPVEITLDKPLGDRLLVDAMTGRALVSERQFAFGAD